MTVQHEISTEGECCIVEEQDIVYREAPKSGVPFSHPIVDPGDEEFVS